MPEKIQPDELEKLVLAKVSEKVVNFSIETSKSNDVIQLVNGESRNWRTMSELLRSYNISVTYEPKIQEVSLKIWNKKKNILKNLEREVRKERMDHIIMFIHYMCLNRTSNWKFQVIRRSEKTVEFLQVFNPNVTDLVITSLKKSQVLRVLLSLRNLVEIEFHTTHSRNCVNIGKYCAKLRTLRFQRRHLTEKHAKRLCYFNHPRTTASTNLCRTLENLDAWMSIQALVFFMKYIRTLKSVNRENIVDYDLIVAESKKSNRKVLPCGLDYVQVMAKFNTINLKEVFQNFPFLKALDLTCTKNQVLYFSNILETLIIHYYTFTNEPYVIMPSLGDLFQTNCNNIYENLKHLALQFVDHVACVNFTDICQHCPNIQSLFLGNCVHDIDVLFLPFLNLEKLLISTTSDVHGCLPIDVLAPTLKTLGIKKNGVTSCREDLTHGLLSYSFPNLEFLEYSPSLAATEDEVFQLLDLCPKLTKLGMDKNVDLRIEIRKQICAFNWNLTLHTAHESLLDLF